ncbi:MAG TPA: S9 family peptidase, partial [Blastocatellia bacterium]|nr:S9 family peptidase [Blastocatellia bacterium]
MRTKMLAVAFALAIAPFAFALDKQTPTVEQSLSLKSASSPRISPDGRYVAYLVQEANWTENAFETEIWIAVTGSGDLYQLTNAKKSSNSPAWSPDGKRLAFASDREGKRQIYLIAPAGGEAAQLTNVEAGVSSFAWSPDGSRIAFTAAEAESKAMKERKEKYGEFEVFNNDYNMTHLWVIDVSGDPKEKMPDPRRITEGTGFTVAGFSWSRDSSRLAFSATKDPDISSSDSSDIYVVALNDKAVKKIVAAKGPDSNPVWSPDDSQIAYQTSNERDFFFYTNSYIAVVPSQGGAPRVLSEAFDEQ